MYLKPLNLPKARILVLEDDFVLRAGLNALLADAGYTPVEGAQSGDPAGQVDLVIAGIGARCKPATLRRKLDPAAPLILLVDHASWNGFDFFDAANELGAVVALHRPFTRHALLQLIAGVLSGSVTHATAPEPAHEEQAGLAELLLSLENPNPA